MSQAPPNGTLRRQLDEMYKAQEPLRRQHEALIRARKLFLQPLTCPRCGRPQRTWDGIHACLTLHRRTPA